MRLIPLCLLAAAASAAEAPPDHARYAAALKEFRSQEGRSLAALQATGTSAEERRAAIDDVRERLVDEPAGPLTRSVATLLGSASTGTALAKDEAIAEDVVQALAKVAGPGVTDAFNAGIRDAKADLPARVALIKAAVVRNNRAVVAALCATVVEEPLRLESQKALLKLATSADLPALRQAEQAVATAATKAALGRLIAKLEKPEGK